MRRRRKRVHSDMTTGGEFSSTSVFVTPMLDMAFQILAFFVFTYSPTSVEGQFPIFLAQGDSAGDAEKKIDEKAATDVLTELRPTIFVEVRAREKGRLGSLQVRAPGEKFPIIVPETVTDDVERSSRMLSALSAKLAELKNQNPTEDRIVIEGTRTLRWEEMMKIIDACRRGSGENNQIGKELFPKVNLGFIDQ